MRISRFPSITFLVNGQFCLSYLSLRYEGKWEVVVFVNSTGLISNMRAGNPMVRSEKCLHLSAYVCICLYKHVTGDHYFRVCPFVWFSMRLFHHCLSAMSNVKLASLPIHPLLTIFLVADTRLYTLVRRSVRRSVRRLVRHIFELRAVFALLLLPNRPRLDCRVSGLVFNTDCKREMCIPNWGYCWYRTWNQNLNGLSIKTCST